MNYDYNFVQKKSPFKLITILVLVSILIIEIIIFVPKMLKSDKKEEVMQVVEEQQVEPVKEIEPVNQEETPVEEPIIEEIVKPLPNGDYKLLREIEDTVTLNYKDYHLYSFYYKDNENKYGILKEMYFEDKLIVKVHHATLILGSGVTVDDFITSDFEETKSQMLIIGDEVLDDEYLVLFYGYDYYYKNRKDWIERKDRLVIVNRDGNILLDDLYKDSKKHLALWVDTIDETYFRSTFKNTNKKSKYIGKYPLYMGTSGKIEDSYFYEFINDDFFHLEERNNSVFDYKYTISNGSLNKVLLKEFSGKEIKSHVQRS